MSTFIEYALCPICGKSSPISKASYKVGEPSELGWIQIRECRGKLGFCKVGTKTLRDNIKEYQRLADELVDFCSGVLMVTMEENLPVHKPAFILKYEQLQEQIKMGTPEREAEKFELDDAAREIKRLTVELEDEKGWHERLAAAYDDTFKELERLKREHKKERQNQEGKTFKVSDLEKENHRLREQNRRLKHQLQAYEKASFS